MSVFQPPWGLRNAHTQSVLASTALRRWRTQRFGQMVACQREEIVDCADGTRLLGFRSMQERSEDSKGLVVLLHGWEGCHESTYMLRTGEYLYRQGFDVFRLNFRDHGPSHHLNQDLFHSCRIDEVVLAVAALARDYPQGPVFLAGFSLGGNFALRVALRAPARNIPLARVVAVSPVISPHNALDAIESGPRMYHSYFIDKWSRSLQRKGECFPGQFDFSAWNEKRGLRALTELMVLQHTDFPRVEDYLEGYSIAGSTLKGLEIPASVITSEDDPIIPVDDYHALPDIDALDLTITRYGGHCGFVRDWRLRGWIEQQVSERLLAASPRR